MEDEIPTAEKFLNSKGITGIQANTISNWMIEFAKLHVEAALKAASESESNGTEGYKIYKDSVLSAYPLTLIK